MQDYNTSIFSSILKLQLIFNVAFLCIQMHITPLSYVVFAVLGVLCATRIVFYAKFDRRNFSIWSNIIFMLYTLYSIYVVTNFNGNYSLNNIMRYAYLPSGILFYIAPLVMVRFADVSLFPTLIGFTYKQTKLYLFILAVYILYDFFAGAPPEKILNDFECLQLYLGGGLVFLLLLSDQLQRSQRKLVWIGVFLVMFLAAIIARRAILLTYAIGICFYFIGQTLSTAQTSKKILLVILYLIILALLSYGRF